MDTKNLLVQVNNLSFKYPSGEYLFENLKLTVKEGDRVAIVGINGSGKSTLLKILAGKIELEEGSKTITSNAYYVPQIDLDIHQSTLKIYEYITEFYENWWEVTVELERLFKLTLDTDAEVKTLSGGELMKLNLTISILHNPEVLLFDEPTNHLDVKSVNALINFIKNDPKGKKYTYIIISHDTYFLDQVVNTVWELNDKKITSYGGNYTFFKEQKALHLRGIKRQLDVANDALQRALRLEQEAEEKQAKKANEAKRAFIKGSIDKRAFNEGKGAASALQHNKSSTLKRQISEAEEKLEDSEIEERRLAFINLKSTTSNADRTLFEVKHGALSINNKELIKDIDLKVVYGNRILISGDNGSGKTTFVKALINKDSNLSGDIFVGSNLAWVYIDQQYSLIDPKLSMLENLMKYNHLITESKAKEQLGKFQFKTEAEMTRHAHKLSGGEMVRLIMAMITSFPTDLVILDEPTNNLDVETIDVLVKSLQFFKGAIIVISHNIDFISRIGITSALIIKDKKLKVLDFAEGNKEEFFKALAY